MKTMANESNRMRGSSVRMVSIQSHSHPRGGSRYNSSCFVHDGQYTVETELHLLFTASENSKTLHLIIIITNI